MVFRNYRAELWELLKIVAVAAPTVWSFMLLMLI